jgi:hypothetical protein
MEESLIRKGRLGGCGRLSAIHSSRSQWGCGTPAQIESRVEKM